MVSAFLLFALPIAAQQNTPTNDDQGRRTAVSEFVAVPQQTTLGRSPHLLRISQAVLLAGNAADAASSWHKTEMNPLLGSRFGVRSAGIKFGISLGSIFGQNSILKRHPEMERPITWGNFVAGAAFGGVAIRNARVN